MSRATILVVDDNPIVQKLVRLTLAGAGYDVLEAIDGRSAIELMESGNPALVLLDLLLPDVHGLVLMEQLRAIPGGREVPIIAFSGLISGADEIEALGAGFTDFLVKPVEPSRLLHTVRAYLPLDFPLANAPVKDRRVLIVDDDPIQLKLLEVQLSQLGFQVTKAEDGMTALEAARRSKPDAIVSDVVMARMDGFKLCQQVKSEPRLKSVPVILVSSYFTNQADEDLARNVGAFRLIFRTPDSKETIKALQECVGVGDSPPSPVSFEKIEECYRNRLILQIKRQARLNASLVQNCTLQAAELSVLSGVSSILAKTQEVEPVLGEILARCADVGEITRAVIYLRNDAGDLALVKQVGYTLSEVKELETFFNQIDILNRSLETKSETVLTLETAPAGTGIGELFQRLKTGCWMVLPITLRDETFGVLVLMTRLKKVSEKSWLEFARIVTTQIGQALALTRTISHLTQSEERFRQLAENITQVFWMSELNFSGVLYISPAYEKIWGRSCRSLYESPSSWLEAVHPEDRGRVLQAAEAFQGEGVYDQEFRIIRPDGSIRWIRDRAFPIKKASGEVYRLTGIAEDITERKRVEGTINRMAYYDATTELPNRALFHQRLREAILSVRREEKPLALLFLDLNNFKEVNNTLSHHYGDLLLQLVGRRLFGVVQEAGTVARLGGDEFAVLLPSANLESATRTAGKILKALEEPFAVEALTLEIGASIGIALWPDHGEEADTLMQQAEMAMYAAKRSDMAGYAVADPERDQANPLRLALMGELRHAIEKDQMILHYQPKANLQTGKIIGVEALVRWNHPNMGMIPPDQFITLAERTGLIKPLTLWVLRSAMHQCRLWQEEGIHLSVAVNLSVRNLQDPNLVDQMTELFQSCNLTPSSLRLEITESILMADPVHAAEVLSRLNGLGIQLSIDDFGTGYSSLGYLRKLPVDEIKIDKSFVKEMGVNDDDITIVRSIIDLAHNLNLKVVAEGVESQAVWDRLTALRCDGAQGYLMSRPLPAGDLTRWLNESSWGVKTFKKTIRNRTI